MFAINQKDKRYIEFFILIIVSISPLIPQLLKILLVLFLVIKNIKIFKKITIYQLITLFLFLCIFTIGIVNDILIMESIKDYSLLNLYFPLCIFFGCLLGIKYTKEETFQSIEKISYLTAFFSILGYFTYTFYPSLVNYLPSYNYYNTTHKTAIIFNVLTPDGGIVKRNAGIASEPGIYQFLLNIGLYAYLKSSEKINLKKIGVYTLAIASTASTAGLAIFAFIIIRVFFNNIKMAALILILIVIFSPIIYEEILYQYEYKLFGSYAFNTRYEPLINTLEIARKNFFGLGNTGYNYYFVGSLQASFDSFTQVFVRYGYGLLLLLSLCLINILKKDFIIFIIFIITFTSQGIWFIPLVSMFYFLYLKKD